MQLSRTSQGPIYFQRPLEDQCVEVVEVVVVRVRLTVVDVVLVVPLAFL